MDRITVKGAQLFRSEIAAARRLGFSLKIAVHERDRVVAACAEPETDRAKVSVLMATGQPGQVLEAKHSFTDPVDRTDVMRETIHAVLDLAGAVTA